jgi:hypothetical protein
MTCPYFSNKKEAAMTATALLNYSISPVIRSIKRVWHEKRMKNFLIAAEHERKTARASTMNAAYFEKQALQSRIAIRDL